MEDVVLTSSGQQQQQQQQRLFAVVWFSVLRRRRVKRRSQLERASPLYRSLNYICRFLVKACRFVARYCHACDVIDAGKDAAAAAAAAPMWPKSSSVNKSWVGVGTCIFPTATLVLRLCSLPPKIWESENVNFRTTSVDVDVEYLQNWTRYRHSETASAAYRSKKGTNFLTG